MQRITLFSATMFFSFSDLLISSLIVAHVCAKPLPPPPAGQIIPINRSFRQKPPHTSSLPVFDPECVRRELRGLRPKYRHVSMYLNGLELTSGIDKFLDTIEAVASADTETEQPFIPPALINTHLMPLKDYIVGGLDFMYYGPVNFGTPAQKLTVDIDTGSGDLWIPTPDCVECENKQFQDTHSSTCTRSNESFSVFYGSGEVSGTLMQDVVSIAGLKIENQYFGAVSRVSDDFNSMPNDGLLGLAFGAIAQSRKPTFFETLIKRNMLPAPLFSVHLARNQESASEVCFGCVDELKSLGPVEWISVLNQTYWSVKMDAVAVNADQVLPTEILATGACGSNLYPLGTTLIYLPDDVVSQVYAMIPGSRLAPQYGPEFYSYPCSTKANIAFSFDGRHFSIDPADFSLGLTARNSPECVGGILSLGSEGFPSNLAIIGDEFLKSWYTTFDYSGGGRIGFSRSVNNK